jgi:hypothetical protein
MSRRLDEWEVVRRIAVAVVREVPAHRVPDELVKQLRAALKRPLVSVEVREPSEEARRKADAWARRNGID